MSACTSHIPLTAFLSRIPSPHNRRQPRAQRCTISPTPHVLITLLVLSGCLMGYMPLLARIRPSDALALTVKPAVVSRNPMILKHRIGCTSIPNGRYEI